MEIGKIATHQKFEHKDKKKQVLQVGSVYKDLRKMTKHFRIPNVYTVNEKTTLCRSCGGCYLQNVTPFFTFCIKIWVFVYYNYNLSGDYLVISILHQSV